MDVPHHAIEVTCPWYATEEQSRLEAAVQEWFAGEVEAQPGSPGTVICKSTQLALFRQSISEARIIDTMRTALLTSLNETGLVVRLNKQAAVQGKLALPGAAHPLGALTVRIQSDDPEQLAWWLCPETAEGQILRDGRGAGEFPGNLDMCPEPPGSD